MQQQKTAIASKKLQPEKNNAREPRIQFQVSSNPVAAQASLIVPLGKNKGKHAFKESPRVIC